ncbi:hypothetical protein P691DRAFT_681686 [Macrolepiota fuliginosa MF-IS2]|uniref:Uncharacterized protein n=1 Tax=Macrolepiota fuliginosa MF-IS2 TaxID=1400762 RepID=A0A9P5X2B0_9AGAR|nr:hypothetical protein P691DRAFT_681686 [Macrolepiota fuliginosa MF-IS2]
MAPITVSLVGYRVSSEAIERYRTLKDLPKYNHRLLVQDLESQVGVPLALVEVERDEEDDLYLCCFIDFSSRPYSPEDLLAIPVPPGFRQLPQLIPVEGDLHRLFAPNAYVMYHDRSDK